MNKMKWMFILAIGALCLLASCEKENVEELKGCEPWICVIVPVEDSIVPPPNNKTYIDGVDRAMEVGEGALNDDNR